MQRHTVEEMLPLVDEQGQVIGEAARHEVHGNPALLHPVVHCIVTNAMGALLLQLRRADRVVQPGKWDTSVGGHVALGETIDQALTREVAEEIGANVARLAPRFLYRYVHQSAIERELVHTFTCCAEGPFQHQESEIDALRFWQRPQIEAAIGQGSLTPNFEQEYAMFRERLVVRGTAERASGAARS